MAFTLCVLLWPKPGADPALVAYEDKVLALLADHGATVRQRVRTIEAEGGAASGGVADGSAVDNATANGSPLEVHLLDFPSDAAFDAYLNDERRLALAAEREQAVARTEILRVDLV